MKKPVVFIIFNRPDTTKVVFEKIRTYQPKKLFVIADGPRENRSHEQELCKRTRELIHVDWDCDVTHIYSEKNLGCQRRISSGLDIVFSIVEEAIILEDDCVPHIDFFKFCEEMLEKYCDNQKIMAISGDCFQGEDFFISESYYFSIYPHCWGWATWRRAWELFDVNMPLWPRKRDEYFLTEVFDDPFAQLYWENVFNKVFNKQIDSWAYPWTFACWLHSGLTILPKKNLVSNIGFGENATHTKGSDPLVDNLPIYSIDFPLNHPKNIVQNKEADQYTTDYIFGIEKFKTRAWIDAKKVLFYEKLLSGIEEILNPYYNICIFGTGKLGRIIYQQITKVGLKVNYFIDNNADMQRQSIGDIPIYSVEGAPDKKIQLIIVSIEGEHDIHIIEELNKRFPNTDVVSWKEL